MNGINVLLMNEVSLTVLNRFKFVDCGFVSINVVVNQQQPNFADR